MTGEPGNIIMKPSIGRIVHYKLSGQDADEINRRRTHEGRIAVAMEADKWSIGAQAHIGNEVKAGEVFPMIIVKVWSDECVNGQVILDGTDQLWKTSPSLGGEEGNWSWPVIEK